MKKRRKKGGCLYTVVTLGGFLCLIIAVISISYGIGTNVDVVKKIEKEFIMPDKVPYQEVVISEEEIVQKFYYQQLEEEERLVYREILDGIRGNGEEIYVHTSDAERANAVFQYVLKDYPEIFWCDGTVTATSYEGEEAYTVLQPTYSYDQTAKEIMEEEMASAIEECLAQVPAESSEYQKILYVYEYIVNTVDYDMAAPDNQNIYSVFKHRRSVCAGYSKAAQYLLEKLGVFCTYVTGITGTGQNHAWNLVKCDGDYYYVDVTWGDPVFQEAEGEEVSRLQNISYDYMLCNDEELLKSHTPDTDAQFPACTKMDRNYYVMNGMYYDSYDGSTALMKMKDVIAAKGNPSVMKFANRDLYNQAHDDVFQNVIKAAAQDLAEKYGLSEVRYQYMDEPENNKITIYWQYE